MSLTPLFGADAVTTVEIDGRSVTGPDRKAAIVAVRKAKAEGLRVREVRIEGRWARDISLPLAVGERLTPELLIKGMEALQAEITRGNAYGLRSKGEVGILWIDVRFEPDPTHATSVAVIFAPHYVHISLMEIGDNVLPIPRSALPTFFDRVPKPLLGLNPSFAAFSDRATGAVLGAGVNTDLLHLADAKVGASDPNQLTLQATGQASLEKSQHRAEALLRYGQRQLTGALQQFGIDVKSGDAKEPLAGVEEKRKTGGLNGSLVFKLAPNTRLAWDVGYRRISSQTGAATATNDRTHEQTNRLVFETIPPRMQGFFRAALWEDNGWNLNSRRGDYQRLSTRIGYAKEFLVWPSQTIGVEVVTGAGKAWGDLPTGSLFFGGNAAGQFLYDGLATPALTTMPAGPVVRSFGQREAGVRRIGTAQIGGRSYWHAGFNVSLPIPKWSRALIPDEPVDTDENNRPIGLKETLKTQINVSGPNLMISTLTLEGMSQAEAEKQAKSVFAEITPATQFIIDAASLVAAKPLLMVDAAGLSDRRGGAGNSVNWVAAGAGLQLTVVIAKFETGYMWTMSGPRFGSRGNFSARLVFQNLF